MGDGKVVESYKKQTVHQYYFFLKPDIRIMVTLFYSISCVFLPL